jgi:hypothetical protein
MKRERLKGTKEERAALAAREEAALWDRHYARIKAAHAAEDGFKPSGRAPRLVCSVCQKGPLDGIAIHRRGALYCDEHKPAEADRSE